MNHEQSLGRAFQLGKKPRYDWTPLIDSNNCPKESSMCFTHILTHIYIYENILYKKNDKAINLTKLWVRKWPTIDLVLLTIDNF